MKALHLLIGGSLFLFSSIFNSTQARDDGLHDFTFNLTVPKNTCDINIEGTSANKVDFGNIPISKFKSDVPTGNLKLPFKVTIQNCKTKNHDGAYISLTGNYKAEQNGFLDDAGKTFAIRISNKNNATQGDADFVTEQNNKLFPKIEETALSKTFYAYVMCKTGTTECADDVNVGSFKATLTLTYVSD